MRSTEEIDIVDLRGDRATVVGGVRWRSKPIDANVLKHPEGYKLPAMAQKGIIVERPIIVLVSGGGYTDSLRASAERDERIRLIEPDQLMRSQDD